MSVLVEVAEGVHVATSAVYMTTSTVLVAPDRSCLVVDPGVTAHEIDVLSSAIRLHGWTPIAVWSTHGHWDHLLDGGIFTGLPRWSGGWPVDIETLMTERDEDDELARVLLASPGDSPAPVVVAPPVLYPSVGGLLDWPGPPVRVVTHGAHAPGSTSLVVPSADVLVAGDLLSDVEIPLLDLSVARPGRHLPCGARAARRDRDPRRPRARPRRSRWPLASRPTSPTSMARRPTIPACSTRGSRPCTSPSGSL